MNSRYWLCTGSRYSGSATGGGFSACKLPIAEVRSAPPGKGFAARSQRCGKKGGDGLGPCVIFHRERRSDIVPRWRLNEARTAERGSGRGIPLEHRVLPCATRFVAYPTSGTPS